MECQEIERLFDQYFDQEISKLEYQALRGHLSRCGTCRENFLNLQFCLELFEVLPPEAPSDTWSAQLVSTMPGSKRETSRSLQRTIERIWQWWKGVRNP